MTTLTPLATIQAAYQAFGNGDVPGLMKLIDDDARWTFHGSAGLAYSGDFRGAQAIRSWFGQVSEIDDIQQFEPREFFAGDRHVTVLGWERSRDRRTGKVFESPWVHLFEVADGRITRFWGIYDTAASATSR